MKSIKQTLEDEREIESLIFPPDGERAITVGENGVETIVPYGENGEYSLILWFAVFVNGKISTRENSKFVESVVYR